MFVLVEVAAELPDAWKLPWFESSCDLGSETGSRGSRKERMKGGKEDRKWNILLAVI